LSLVIAENVLSVVAVIMGIVSYSFSKECYKSGCLATGFPFITSQSV